MDNDLKVCLKIIINVTLNKEWHDIYLIHKKYRISPVIMINAIKKLQSLNLVEFYNYKIRLVGNMTNQQLSVLNYLSKTDKPQKLNEIFLEL